MRHRTEVTNRAPLYRPSLGRSPTAPPVLALSGSPLAELLEDDPVGEALAADADAFQHPVTPQLLQHQKGIQLAGLQRWRGRWATGGWDLGSSKPQISGVGNAPPHQATRINPVRFEMRVQVISLLYLVTLASPSWKMGLLLVAFPFLTSCPSPVLKLLPPISSNPPTSPHWPSPLPFTRHPLLLPRQSPPQLLPGLLTPSPASPLTSSIVSKV